jgi:hypothetical protein
MIRGCNLFCGRVLIRVAFAGKLSPAVVETLEVIVLNGPIVVVIAVPNI